MIRVVWQKGDKITYKQFPFFLTYEEADRLGEEKGYGKTVFIDLHSNGHFVRRIMNFVNNFKNGIRSHCPVCCVLNFCVDHLLGRPSAQLRWSSRTDYVECVYHVRRNGGKEEIPVDLY